MDLIRLGRAHRAIRIHLRKRQLDVAAAAGVSQQMVARLEGGRAGSMPLAAVDAMFAALDARVFLNVVWNGGVVDRLLDEGHAAVGGLAAELLLGDGWEVLPEVTYAVFGERGSIDLLAWHAATRTLLVVEVKTEITSAEEMLRRHDAKVRLAAGIGEERFGVRPAVVGRLLVVADSSGSRGRVARLGRLLDAVYPMRGRDLRAWLAAPSAPSAGQGNVGGLLFLNTTRVSANGRPVRPQRVRRPSGARKPLGKAGARAVPPPG